MSDWRKLSEDLLPGGLADDLPDSAFDPDELAKGIEVESEHTPNKGMEKEIAKDHLTEIPDYYTRLAQMEKDAELKESVELDFSNSDAVQELIGDLIPINTAKRLVEMLNKDSDLLDKFLESQITFKAHKPRVLHLTDPETELEIRDPLSGWPVIDIDKNLIKLESANDSSDQSYCICEGVIMEDDNADLSVFDN
jgi:hypothetical protein